MKFSLYLLVVFLILCTTSTIILMMFHQGTSRYLRFVTHSLFSRSKHFTNTRKNRSQDLRSQLDIKVLFVGVKKCGTSSLKVFISQHPQVLVRNKPHVCRPRPYPSYRSILDAQEEANEEGKILIVENNECFHNIKYFDRLKKPEKLILLLCDPILRAYSDYKHLVRTFLHRKSFYETIENAASVIQNFKRNKPFGEYLSNFRYNGHLDYSIVSVGFYYEYLKEFYARYDPKDILILSGETLKQNPAYVMRRLEKFIGLDMFFNDSKFVKHPSTGFYCFQQTPDFQPRCIGVDLFRNFSPPEKAATDLLKDLYKPYNEELFKLTNRTFLWI